MRLGIGIRRRLCGPFERKNMMGADVPRRSGLKSEVQETMASNLREAWLGDMVRGMIGEATLDGPGHASGSSFPVRLGTE